MNQYVFNVKYSHITRLCQTLPIEAETKDKAEKIALAADKAERAELLAVKIDGCWHNEEPAYTPPTLPIPDDPRIYNKPQADGTYRPLNNFFDGIK